MISCQKEHITTANTTVGSPVFYFNGTVGGNNVKLQAGKSNYYMYSSYTQDNNKVYNYIANLKEFNCNSNCVSSIQFIINDFRALPAGSSEKNISDSSLTPGYYGYSSLSITPTKFGVGFNSSIGQGSNPVSYTYNFGDGVTQSNTGAPPASFNHTYYNQGNYNTSLSVTFPGNHITSLSDSLNLGTPTKAITATLSYTDSATVTYKVVINGGTKPYNIVWSFGDTSGTPNTSTHPSVNSTTDTARHIYISKGIHTASVTIKDSHNISVTANTYIVPLGGNNSFAMNYSISAPVPITDSLGLSNVTIIYTDPSGDVYTTADSTQKGGNFFQVVSVAPYNNNENNETTKQLHVKFNCTLYDNTGKSLTITNGDAVIAVAYK
jgi:hypothetical protein